MLFQRLSYKTDLINTLVGQSYNFPESLYGEVSDSSLVGVCEVRTFRPTIISLLTLFAQMRGLTAHVSTLCKRFAAVLRRCDGEFYLNIGKLFPEIAPMEKRIDMHIDTLRREEFRFLECGSDIQKLVLCGRYAMTFSGVSNPAIQSRMLGQFDHLAETYFSGSQFDLGECELDRILSVEHDLDYFVAAIGLTKNHLETVMNDEGTTSSSQGACHNSKSFLPEVIVELEDLDLDSQVLSPMNDILDASRSAKAASRFAPIFVTKALCRTVLPPRRKISKRIEDLLRESAALREDAIPQLSSLAETVTKATDFGIQVRNQDGFHSATCPTHNFVMI
jgi:dynactin 1